MRIVIFGAGGHGKVVLDVIRALREHDPVGFIDADARLHGKTVAGLPVIGSVSQLHKLMKTHRLKGAVFGIGDNAARAGLLPALLEHNLETPSLIHPRATVAGGVTMGRGCLIAAGAVVCTETSIGDGVIVNTGASVDHECQVNSWSHLCPGARLAGRVRVGEFAFVGMNATVIQCLSIGAHATIGAGAVVLGDVPARATAVGVPARVLRAARV